MIQCKPYVSAAVRNSYDLKYVSIVRAVLFDLFD